MSICYLALFYPCFRAKKFAHHCRLRYVRAHSTESSMQQTHSFTPNTQIGQPAEVVACAAANYFYAYWFSRGLA